MTSKPRSKNSRSSCRDCLLPCMKITERELTFLHKLFKRGVLGFSMARDIGVIDTARHLKALHLVDAGLYGFTITKKGIKEVFK